MTTDRVWGCCGKKWGESHARDCPRGSPYQHPFLLASRAGEFADRVHRCEGCNVTLDTATWPYALCLECRKKVSVGGDPLVQEIESIQREQSETPAGIRCPCCGAKINITLVGAGR